MLYLASNYLLRISPSEWDHQLQNVIIILALSQVYLCTLLYQGFVHLYYPGGVWVPVLHAYTHTPSSWRKCMDQTLKPTGLSYQFRCLPLISQILDSCLCFCSDLLLTCLRSSPSTWVPSTYRGTRSPWLLSSAWPSPPVYCLVALNYCT